MPLFFACIPMILPAEEPAIFNVDHTIKQFEFISESLELGLLQDTALHVRMLERFIPAAGRERVIQVLENVLERAEAAGAECTEPWFVITGALMRCGERQTVDKHYAFLTDWTLSGTWNRYGRPDADYRFQPETSADWSRLNTKKAYDRGMGFFPFSRFSDGEGVVYAKTAFSEEGRVWLRVMADVQCRIFINGRDYGICPADKSGRAALFRLGGSAAYSIMLKFYSRGNEAPGVRVMLTGEDGTAPRVSARAGARVTPASVDRLDIDLSRADMFSGGGERAEELHNLITGGRYEEALKRGAELVAEYPENYFLYGEFASVLGYFNMESELLKLCSVFQARFPSSKSPYLWLVRYYAGRDRDRFMANMARAELACADLNLIKAYVYCLAASGELTPALDLALRYILNPAERCIVIAVLYNMADKRREAGQVLLEGAVMTGDSRVYYRLGCIEEMQGLDPVIYWRKALESEPLFAELSDMIDVYENASPGKNIYYTGWHTKEKRGFRHDGIRRKIKVHLFESGRVYAVITDFIPEKIISGNTSGGMYRHRTVQDAALLYVLKAGNDRFESAVTLPSIDSAGWFDVAVSGGCEYLVAEYSLSAEKGRSSLVPVDMPVIMKNEFVEEIDIELICHGEIVPDVVFNDMVLRERRSSDGIRFIAAERFRKSASEDVGLVARRFGSAGEFNAWYCGLVDIRGRFTGNDLPSIAGSGGYMDKLAAVCRLVLHDIRTEGETDFSPRRPAEVIAALCATPEEKALLAMAVLEKAGIKSFMAFGTAEDGSVVDKNRVLLCVPDEADGYYWIDPEGNFYTDGERRIKTAVVIDPDGSRTLSVDPARVIKE